MPLPHSYEYWDLDGKASSVNGNPNRTKRGQRQQPAKRLGQQAQQFPENSWMHVAVVHGGDGTATIFLNGTLCAKGPVDVPPCVPRGAPPPPSLPPSV